MLTSASLLQRWASCACYTVKLVKHHSLSQVRTFGQAIMAPKHLVSTVIFAAVFVLAVSASEDSSVHKLGSDFDEKVRLRHTAQRSQQVQADDPLYVTPFEIERQRSRTPACCDSSVLRSLSNALSL